MANVLQLPFRLTEPIPTLADSLVQHVCDADPTIHPDAIRPDADGLSNQRKALFGQGGPLEVQEAVLTGLVAYYAQLSYASTKLPDDVSVSFPWHPIFGVSTLSILGGYPSASAVSLPSLQYERLSVLFNIAAMHAALGAQAKRTDQEGIKRCLMSFQKAAGALSHLISLLPLCALDPPAQNPPSPEFSVKALEALRDMCLAQAQEAFWQKAVMDRLKNGTIAKLAAKVSEYYAAAFTEATEAKGAPESWPSFAFPSPFMNHLTLKQLHFAAVAQFRKSIDDLGANRYGDELGRLTIAEGFVKKAMEGSRKGVAEPVIRDLKGLERTLADNIARAEKDNRLIYLEAVTPLSALPPIVPASMVKITIPPELAAPLEFLHNGPGGFGKPYFETLVPKEVSLAIRVYNDRKVALLKEVLIDQRDELDAVATACLDSLGLPGSIQAIIQPVGLPPSLLAKARDIRSSGGVEGIKTMMKDVRRVAQLNGQILNESLQILAHEEAEDQQHRLQFGTDRWTRPPSASVNTHLTSRAESLGSTLRAAGSSDGVVRGKFAEWETQITLLGSDVTALEASIPALAPPSLTSKQSSSLTNLRTALQELDDVRAGRDRSIEEAKQAIANDDIRPQITTAAMRLPDVPSSGPASPELPTAQFEDLFETELAKFSRFRRALEVSASEQEDALDRIKTANTAFIQSRKNDAMIKAREAALQGLDTAFHKYREITTNLEEGLKFYSEISKLLNELRDSCKQWAYARNIESRDQLQALTGALGRMTLNPGVYDPAKHGPVRFG